MDVILVEWYKYVVQICYKTSLIAYPLWTYLVSNKTGYAIWEAYHTVHLWQHNSRCSCRARVRAIILFNPTAQRKKLVALWMPKHYIMTSPLCILEWWHTLHEFERQRMRLAHFGTQCVNLHIFFNFDYFYHGKRPIDGFAVQKVKLCQLRHAISDIDIYLKFLIFQSQGNSSWKSIRNCIPNMCKRLAENNPVWIRIEHRYFSIDSISQYQPKLCLSVECREFCRIWPISTSVRLSTQECEDWKIESQWWLLLALRCRWVSQSAHITWYGMVMKKRRDLRRSYIILPALECHVYIMKTHLIRLAEDCIDWCSINVLRTKFRYQLILIATLDTVILMNVMEKLRSQFTFGVSVVQKRRE